MNEELKITNEDIQLLKEMKENCLKTDVYEDEKRLLKANAITKFLILQNNWNELKRYIDNRFKAIKFDYDEKIIDKFEFVVRENELLKLKMVLKQMQELEGKSE